MLGLSALRGHDTDPDACESLIAERPEDTKLWLPSQIPEAHRNAACLCGVVVKEKWFHHAQVTDTLIKLRRSHQVQKRVWDHYKVSVAGTGQKQMTRSRVIINSCIQRIANTFNRYNTVRSALLTLDPNGNWKDTYQVLTAADNKGPTRGFDKGPLGNGKWTPSWIWTARIDPEAGGHQAGETSQEVMNREYNDAMCIKWVTAVAHADRWEEEYDLVLMEMGRTLKFLEWKAGEWDRRADQIIGSPKDEDICRDRVAYARKQAAVNCHLACRAFTRFKLVLADVNEQPDWLLTAATTAAPTEDLASTSLLDTVP